MIISLVKLSFKAFYIVMRAKKDSYKEALERDVPEQMRNAKIR